jgi:hypothetical protein
MRFHIDWANVAIVFGGASACLGLYMLLGTV